MGQEEEGIRFSLFTTVRVTDSLLRVNCSFLTAARFFCSSCTKERENFTNSFHDGFTVKTKCCLSTVRVPVGDLFFAFWYFQSLSSVVVVEFPFVSFWVVGVVDVSPALALTVAAVFACSNVGFLTRSFPSFAVSHLLSSMSVSTTASKTSHYTFE